ncbi:MAG: methyltransferase domain-containing protein [Sphingomonadales bacterium]|nr:methyltransferase domain-containing protein [Sphingomonadales bacterium]
MTNGADWQAQVGKSWAEMYSYTDRSFSGLTQRLLDRISGYAGEAVLDVGCGAGELALAVARGRSHARIVGLDLSADLIAAAQTRGGQHGNVEFTVGDGATWRRDFFSPDLLVSRHGVMFFDDPVAAFTHLRDIAVPGAQMVFSCFRAARDNPWMGGMANLLGLPPVADPHAPGPFAFADPQRVEGILGDAGWRNIDLEPVDFAYVAGMGEDPVADAQVMFSRIGPAAPLLRELPDDRRAAVLARMAEWLATNRSGNLVAFPAAAWIVTARNG